MAVATMRDTSGEDIAKLQDACQLWREKNSLLKGSCGSSLTKESLQNDDAKVKLYWTSIFCNFDGHL